MVVPKLQYDHLKRLKEDPIIWSNCHCSQLQGNSNESVGIIQVSDF